MFIFTDRTRFARPQQLLALTVGGYCIKIHFLETSNIENVTGKIKYEFVATVWKYDGAAGWHFISLPNEISTEIRSLLKKQEEGWGRLQANAKIENSEWKTAIWFDTKLNTYLLPVKAEVRKKEKIETGKLISVSVWV